MTDSVVGILVVGLAGLLLAVTLRVRQIPTFSLVLLSRWLRWILFGFGMAYLARLWFESDRPYWALAPSFLLLWILIESVYTWLVVRALSLSNIPVYPSYRSTDREVTWPVARDYLRIKDEIHSLGFEVRSSLSADLSGEIEMGSILYLNKDGNIRLQVIFAPRATGRPAVFCVYSSYSVNNRWVTDNAWLPHGGVFPEEWNVLRKPFNGSPKALLGIHRKELEQAKEDLGKFVEDPEELIDQLNEEQGVLDRESTEKGILFPRGMRPELGKLTGDGRYRVWKQILLLNYLGRVGKEAAK